MSQPHSYQVQEKTDTFCPYNGGSSGSGYSPNINGFRPATPRSIQRLPANKDLSSPCSLYSGVERLLVLFNAF
jgi:hypothetical protein